MKRPNKYSKPLGGIRTQNYHPSDYTNNQYADDLNKYIDYLESEVKKLNLQIMTREQVILQKKATALNAIRKLYHPLTKHGFTYYEGEGSRMEQISFLTERIIKQLEKDLLELKQK